MQNSDETVADIVKEMRTITFGEERCPDCGADFQRSNQWPKFAERIESAHNREVMLQNKRLEYVVNDSSRICGLCEASKKILELRECLNEAVKDFCESCDDEDENGCSLCRKECRVNKWRKALEMEEK